MSNGDDDKLKTSHLQLALRRLPQLTELDLTWATIGDDGAKAMAAALEKNTSLLRLDLRRNKIDSEGVKALAAALATNTSLRSLTISWNNFADEGAVALAAALAKNTSLQRFDLCVNKIGDIGAVALAAALAKNTSLLRLDLRINPFGDQGYNALRDALRVNFSLKNLLLKFKNFRPPTEIYHLLQRSKFFRQVVAGTLSVARVWHQARRSNLIDSVDVITEILWQVVLVNDLLPRAETTQHANQSLMAWRVVVQWVAHYTASRDARRWHCSLADTLKTMCRETQLNERFQVEDFVPLKKK